MKIKLENIKAVGKKRNKFIKRVKRLIALLNLTDVNKTLIISNKPHIPMTRKPMGYVTNLEYETMFMYLNPKGQEKVETLCHEMIHVKQYAKSELSELFCIKTKRTIGLVWKGKLFTQNNSLCPWEIEAYSNERSLAKKILG